MSSENPLQNCRLAFDVASKLGVPRVLDPSEVVSKSRSPDLLSMMTYLHQIRTFCCERTKNNDENSPCTNDNLVLNGIFEQCIKTNKSVSVVKSSVFGLYIYLQFKSYLNYYIFQMFSILVSINT